MFIAAKNTATGFFNLPRPGDSTVRQPFEFVKVNIIHIIYPPTTYIQIAIGVYVCHINRCILILYSYIGTVNTNINYYIVIKNDSTYIK